MRGFLNALINCNNLSRSRLDYRMQINKWTKIKVIIPYTMHRILAIYIHVYFFAQSWKFYLLHDWAWVKKNARMYIQQKNPTKFCNCSPPKFNSKHGELKTTYSDWLHVHVHAYTMYIVFLDLLISMQPILVFCSPGSLSETMDPPTSFTFPLNTILQDLASLFQSMHWLHWSVLNFVSS